MQTSLARRRRRQRNDRRGGSGGIGVVGAVAIIIPLFLFATLALAGFLGFATVVSAYNGYAEGLPDPKSLFEEISFDQPTKVYDRTGTVELATLGEIKRELATFEEIPPEVIDATTAIEDNTFWENVGFDPIGIASAAIDTLRGRERGASTITQQLVRNELLPAWAFEGTVYDRKIREIIQSVRLTQAFPGEEGKEKVMEAYLNGNFYGNQSYGVKAAARSYFDKELEELTLAEAAILAGILPSPTAYDLVRNAESRCLVETADGAECPADQTALVVPAEREIVQRRNYILELMKTRSWLSGERHTLAEYEAAKREPVILAPQKIQPWKAAHFVWQVQRQLSAILCGPENADVCDLVDTGGYRVTTTLDWDKQQIVERWLYASARAPNLKGTDGILEGLSIPKGDWGWIRELRGKNINNAAGAVMDARTGEVLAYGGSAGYSAAGTEKFQPQFDVLSDGYRQPGSAIKPIDYVIGIDDKTMTASTLFMDVVTDFTPNREPYTPTQADGLERGPVRLRSALQFSLNVPAIKSGFINGLDHQYERSQDLGVDFIPGSSPVISMSIGTIETKPISMLTAYGTIANGGAQMPRTMILEVVDSEGKVVWPEAASSPTPQQVISPQAAWIISDVLAGNTDKSQNPYWAEWAVFDGKQRREAGYKTGTTEDTVDVAAYGFLAPPSDPEEAQLVVGVWMGNSNTDPTGSLSLDSAAPLWSRIMRDVSRGLPLASFADARPGGVTRVEVDAHSGMLPGPYTSRTVGEWFISDAVPRQADSTKVGVEIDEATGDLWQEGCAGPAVTQGFLDFSGVETAFPDWRTYTDGWVARAAKGVGVAGGPAKTKTKTVYFYNGAFAPFGKSWGAPFKPTETCEPPASPPPCDPFWTPDPNASLDPAATPTPCIPTPPPSPTPAPSQTPKPKPSPAPSESPKPGKPSPAPSPSPAAAPVP
jgi:penicillin-binding protein 1A